MSPTPKIHVGKPRGAGLSSGPADWRVCRDQKGFTPCVGALDRVSMHAVGKYLTMRSQKIGERAPVKPYWKVAARASFASLARPNRGRATRYRCAFYCSHKIGSLQDSRRNGPSRKKAHRLTQPRVLIAGGLPFLHCLWPCQVEWSTAS